jgi:hypothetical protein
MVNLVYFFVVPSVAGAPSYLPPFSQAASACQPLQLALEVSAEHLLELENVYQIVE